MTQPSLFDFEATFTATVNDISTEGIKYAGSKKKLIPVIKEIVDGLGVRSVYDGFSGTTRVSQALAKSGYKVTASDLSEWSRVFGDCYLLDKRSESHYHPLISHLNNLTGIDGWFTENYGGLPNDGISIQKDGKKKIWQIHNTRKLDAIRDEIEKISNDDLEKSVLLTSLILAMDKVDNTLGHHVSYLREWSKRSYDQMEMRVPRLIKSREENSVLRGDTLKLCGAVNCDLSYYDPPYGSSNEKMPPSRVRYTSYYHLWTTICLNDKPKLVGAANRREDAGDSVSGSIFEEYRRDEKGKYIAVQAIEDLISRSTSNFVLLSYSNQGRSTKKELVEYINDMSYKHKIYELGYKNNVMSNMRWTNKWTDESRDDVVEYLILIEKT